MKDAQLKKIVLDELAYEPSVDASNIGVTAENGVVALTGHVPSYRDKLAIEKAVRRIAGVKGIAEEIEVRYPTDKKIHDDEIAKRALAILAWTTALPPGAVQVKVQHGWVELTGRVAWQFQRFAAEASVRLISGVVGVINHIHLTESVQPLDVKQRISKALERCAQIEADRIRIFVEPGGEVTVEGDVENWDQYHAVEHAVWSAPGVRLVDDRVTIA